MMEADQLTLFAPDTLASLSHTPGSDLARMMTATSGQKCLELCKSSGLLGSLERMLLGTSLWASTAYLLTWKVKATAQGRSYFQLQPSKPHTDERECSLWATPSASDSVGSHGGGQGRSLRTDISNWKKGLWPTPVRSDHKRRGPNSKQQGLPEAVRLWPTPQARDYRSADNPDSPRVSRKTEQGWSPNLNDAVKLWPTPRANDAEKRGNINSEDPRNGLPAAVKLWPTPKATLRGDCPSERERRTPDLHSAVKMWPTPAAQDAKNATLPPSQIDRDTVPGAVMREGHQGQLNPDWVECLMGFPIGWTDIERDETESHWIDDPRWPAGPQEEQYDWEPPRVASGVKNRVPRLKACGNAVVPAHAYPFMAAIKALHDSKGSYHIVYFDNGYFDRAITS